MPNTFEDIEEGRNLTQSSLPIKEVKRKTLKQIVSELMPDPSVKLDESLRFRIHRAMREQGKTTTDGSIVVAVSALRKETGINNTAPGIKTTTKKPLGGGKTLQRKARGPYAKKAAEKSPARVPEQSAVPGVCSCKCPVCLLHDDFAKLAVLKQVMEALKS